MQLGKEEQKVLLIWGIVAVVFALLVILVGKKIDDRVKQNDIDSMENITLGNDNFVSNSDLYYTVKSAINKYYSYIGSNDNISLYKIIDSKYIKELKITESNIFDKLKEDNNVSYTSYYPSCVKDVHGSVIDIVAKGEIVNNETFEHTKLVYFNVELNYNNLTFTIKPIDEKKYEEVCYEKNN